MQCLSPVYLNQGGRRLFVPCGKCNFCLESRRADWTIRLRNQQKESASAHFITLTYAEEVIPLTPLGLPTLQKSDLQLFFKGIRNYMTRNSTYIENYEKNGLKWPKFKYYAVGEYGTVGGRPHYHIISFNIDPKTIEQIEIIWGKGRCQVAECNPATIHYTTKYVINKDFHDVDTQKPFSLSSQDLGLDYVKKNAKWHVENQNFYVVSDEHKKRLPRYYKDKIFNSWEKQIHAAKQEKRVRDEFETELTRLAQYHENPVAYHSERIFTQHDQVKIKANKRNRI